MMSYYPTTTVDPFCVQVVPSSGLGGIQPYEGGRQSPVPSSAPSTVLSFNPLMQPKSGHIPTVTFVLNYPPFRQHIVLPLPETYEDAIQALCDFYNSHKAFLNGPATFRSDPNQIVLEIRLRVGPDIGTNYAVIEPSLWSQLVQPGSWVKVWSVDADGSNFMNGPVYLCFAKRAENAVRTIWTVPDEDDMIDRPVSYKHAVELVKRRIGKGGRDLREWKNKDLTHASFTFYTIKSSMDNFIPYSEMDAPKPSGVIATMKRWFESQAPDERVWTKLHPDIYDDEEAWRRWVPLPGACLGVIIEERAT